MNKVLVIDNSVRDAERLAKLLEKEGLSVEVCERGVQAERVIATVAVNFVAAIILWEIPGPPFGFDLLARCQQTWPEMPVIVSSGVLDATLATRALGLGAKDFLEKPFDAERVRSCLRALLADKDSLSPLVIALRERMQGESTVFLATLKQIAKVIPHTDSRVLLVGESGTGKELLALSIHQTGPLAKKPLIAVNISQITPSLVESAIFGHEKGAFTGADKPHIGYLEEAGDGTLFLDEIGELSQEIQVKLLRVIQENQFRRLNGEKNLPFNARLICATNRDLAEDAGRGKFRLDFFHRIAQVTIRVPSLRERKDDIELLLRYFLDLHRGEREVRFARETLTILRSYTYPGNIRELGNLVSAALIECDGNTLLPQHLPWRNMGAFLSNSNGSNGSVHQLEVSSEESSPGSSHQELFRQLEDSLPNDWMELSHRDAFLQYERVFDRVYLSQLLQRFHYNVTRAAGVAGIDTKTFRKKWKESGLPLLRAGAEDTDG